MNCRFNAELSSDEERTLRVRQSVITTLIVHAMRSAIITNERPAGWYAIRSVSLIAKSVPSVRDRLLIENYPRTIARTAILRDRGPVGAGSSRRPLISTVSGPVLDTMGPKVCPILLPSRYPLPFERRPAACYTRGKAEHVRNLRARDCPQRAPLGPFRSDKRWSAGAESETS